VKAKLINTVVLCPDCLVKGQCRLTEKAARPRDGQDYPEHLCWSCLARRSGILSPGAQPAGVESWVQEVEWRVPPTRLGAVLYIKIARYDGRPMGWEEVWARFAAAYPGRWAVQVFPPLECLVNDANYYHLFVLDEGEPMPASLTINREEQP
jgi:hypothetical protein